MVNLRPLEETDLTKLIKWRNDPEVTAHLALPTMTAQEVKEYFNALDLEQGSLAYGVEYSGELIGYTVIDSIDRKNRKCDFGLVIGEKSYWGKGIGKQVIKQLIDVAVGKFKMHRMCAYVSPSNIASIQCFKSVGFQEEGRLRDGYIRDGQFYDVILLALLESDK